MNEFTERQHFRQPLLWIGLGVADCAMLFLGWNSLFHSAEYGDRAVPFAFLLIIFCVLLGVNALLWFMSLDTRIDTEGIHYRFTPFIPKYRTVQWTELRSVQVRHYRPIVEYGGWGYRIGVFGAGQALNIRGTVGIQLVFQSGKRLLLGTQKEDDARVILTHFGFAQLMQ